jgi:hypothetical protein
MAGNGEQSDVDGGQRYGRRWFRHALSETVQRYDLRGRFWLATVFGPLLGILVLGIALGAISSIGDALFGLVAGVVGVLILALLTFVWSFVNTPAELEREAAAAGSAREHGLEQEIAQSQAELGALQERLADETIHGVSITPLDEEVLAVDIGQNARQAWEGAARAALMKGVRRTAGSGYPFNFLEGDSRSPDQYADEVAQYIEGIGRQWIARLRAAAIADEITPLLLEIRNLRDVGLRDVEVRLHLAPDAGAGWDEDEEWIEPPERPEPWGNRTLYANIRLPNIRPVGRSDPGRIERVGDHLVVAYDRVDVSPHGSRRLAPVHIFLPREAGGDQVTIPWTAASLHFRGTCEGFVKLRVTETLSDPRQLLVATEDLP